MFNTSNLKVITKKFLNMSLKYYSVKGLSLEHLKPNLVIMYIEKTL